MAETPVGLVPVIGTAPPNPDLRVYTGEFFLEQNGSRIRLRGSLIFTWVPTVQLRFHGKAETGAATLELDEAVVLGPRIGLNCPVLITGRWIGPRYRYTGSIAGHALIGLHHDAEAVAFCLANFHDIIGESVRYMSARSVHITSGRLVLRARGWRVTVDQQPPQPTNRRGNDRRGYTTHHACVLSRTTTAPISIAAARTQLDALRLLFAFFRGFWCGPILPHGMNAALTQKVWSSWASWFLTPWRSVSSWYPTFHPTDTAPLYGAFLRKWRDPFWRRTLTAVISWYVQANAESGSSEASIVTAFVGLEQLAWAYVVEEARLQSRSAFDRLRAHQRIEALLNALGIPTRIPCEFVTLQNAAGRRRAHDGPAILAKVRNEIVHAKKQRRGNPAMRRDVLFEARELSLGYLELSILAVLDYNGRYTRRITGVSRAKATTRVPWCKP